MVICCIGPNNHQPHPNRSSDGGSNQSGWAHSYGGPSPCGAAAEIHGLPGREFGTGHLPLPVPRLRHHPSPAPQHPQGTMRV